MSGFGGGSDCAGDSVKPGEKSFVTSWKTHQHSLIPDGLSVTRSRPVGFQSDLETELKLWMDFMARKVMREMKS